MKKNLILIFMSLLLISACQEKEQKQNPEPSNPFLSEYDTPFKVPPFGLIDTSHYIPAYEKGIAEQQAEIDAIVANRESPTFENTIVPYDQSGKLFHKVDYVFSCLNSANTTPALQNIERVVSPKITQHQDNLSLNNKLFQRIKTVYENRINSNLNPEQKRVVEKYYSDFVRNGVNLNEEGKTKLRELNQQISEKEIKFNENLLAETNTNFKLTIDKKEELAGLPQADIDAAATTAKEAGMEGKWIFTLQKPSLIPFLQYAQNRDLREKIYRGYFMRCNNNDAFDNKEIIVNIMNLRTERAKLLGFKSHADYIISENMAKTPEKVYEFLQNLMKPALAVAKKDRDAMQKIIAREGGKFKLESWDWWYYAEKLRKEKYNLDESEIKPYFALENVRNGMFNVANKLYGISFAKLKDVPVYDPEVEVFEVKDADSSHLGVLYLDYYPRPGKSVGAWCSSFRDQGYENGKKIYPVVTIVCNFTRPSGDLPALLTWDEVTTLFHEFGHGIHSLFIDGKYRKTAGNVPNDMIELPSQFMENFAGQPEVLKMYAKHYKTGEVIPQELVDRLEKSLVFNQAFTTVEYIAASVLDINLHSFQEPQKFDVLAFEKQSMEKINLMKEILPRYRTTYFSHIVKWAYDAGYYVYLWAAVLDSDAFQAFLDSGDIYNKEIATKFRKYILTEGGTGEGMVQYLKFRGKDPSMVPLLKKRGLN
jgi:peptidyl-dipeptidase Dcp